MTTNDLARVAEQPAAPSGAAGESRAGQSTGSRPALAVLLVVVLGLATGLRTWVIVRSTVPVILPDEVGSWSVARWVAGVHPSIPMGDVPTTPVATGVLLAPVARLIHSSVAQYRSALVITSLLLVLAGVLLSRWAAKVGFAGSDQRVGAFALVVLFPAAVLTSTFTWSEAAALASLAGLLLLTEAGYRLLAPGAIAAGATVAGLMPFVHGRFLLVPLIWAGGMIGFVLRSDELGARQRRARATLAGLVTAVVVAIGLVGSHQVVGALWTHPASNSAGLAHLLLDGRYWRRLAAELVGQLWYLVASSFGLAALGGWWLGRTAFRRTGRRTPVTAALRTTAAMLASVVVVSVATVAKGVVQRDDRPVGRLDYFVHGRYIDAVVVVLSVLGLGQLLAATDRSRIRRRAMRVLAVMWALAAVVQITLPQAISGFLGPAIAGVYSLPFVSGFDIVRWTAVATVGLLLITVAARSRAVLLVTVVGVLLAGACGASAKAVGDHGRWARSGLYAGVPPAAGARTTVAIASDVAANRRYGLASFTQMYVLTNLGWRFELSPLPSVLLPVVAGPDVGVLVLARNQPVDEARWQSTGHQGVARVWVRRARPGPGGAAGAASAGSVGVRINLRA